VTPVHLANGGRTGFRGGLPRILAVLSFETTPGVQLNDYTRLKFFGRTSAAEPVPPRGPDCEPGPR